MPEAGICIEAAKSPGPKIKASSRGEAAAMAAQRKKPAAVSIWASMPIGRARRWLCSICVSSRSTKSIAPAPSARRFNDFDHVAVGKAGVEAVDAQNAQPPPEVEFLEGARGQGAAGGLFLERHGIFQVEADRVGLRGRGLFD